MLAGFAAPSGAFALVFGVERGRRRSLHPGWCWLHPGAKVRGMGVDRFRVPRRYQVRVPLEDVRLWTGVLAVEASIWSIWFRVPASAPEVELEFEGWVDEDGLRRWLVERGFTVLAVRVAGVA